MDPIAIGVVLFIIGALALMLVVRSPIDRAEV